MKNLVKEYVLTTIGIALVAAGMYFFLMPNNLATGGVNGLGIVINHFYPTYDVGFLMMSMNVVLFIVAFLVIGTSFGIKTIYASLGLSGMIWALEHICPMSAPFTNDMLLELLFGILISAGGMGIVFNQNASTGGTDIIAKIINKFFHIDIGKAVLISDFVVTMLAGVTFGVRVGMYAVLGLFINGFFIDAVIEGINVCKNVVIISTKCDEIEAYIINELGRGATIYDARGAYTKEDKEVITTVIGRKEFISLREYIKKIDKDAFITVNTVHETFGEGFKSICE